MKSNIKKTLLATVLATAGFATSQAMPAYPKPITVTQPDGTKVTICLRGDEHLNWAETTDGYTLLRDDAGFWAFANADKSGAISPSALRYTGSTLQAQASGIKPGLRYTPAQRATKMKKAAPQTKFLVDGSFPATGKRKLLVLLVNYSDTKTTYTQQNFYDMMNKEGYGGIGSFRDYYKEQSYGQLDIDVTVTDWITLPKSKAAYGPEGAAEMIYDALSIATKTIDIKQFDNDGDGILDGLAVIHQGTGQEISGNSSDIWSHSAVVYGQTFDGVTVRRYTIEPEQLALEKPCMATIGVICHEFGHALGAPDFYDSDYSGSGGEFKGTGAWDILGGGAWLGYYGDRPAGINGWQKYIFGWTEPKTLENDTVVADMPAADKEPVAYRMETGTPGEYFFMENRQNTGTFDSSLPGHGLVVYHVNENIIHSSLFTNDINAGYPQGIYTVCSDAGVEPDEQPASFGDVNSGAAPFPGEYGHTEFSDRTLPSTRSLDGRYAYRSLTNITDANGKVGFTFTHEQEPAKPQNLVANTYSGDVTLSWSMPEDAGEVETYTIYRNNEKVGTSTSTSFVDQAPEGGKLLNYQVDATYKNQLISHPSSVSIMVPGNKVTDVTASVVGNDVKLNWTTYDKLQWASTNMSNLTYMDINGDALTYANRFSAENLATYVGGKITRIGFIPMQGPSEITVNLKVYEADADGSNAQVVSERSVKEFAKSQPRDLKLTKAVEIKEGKEYWVAIETIGKNGVVTVACDQSALVEGFGNCIVSDGKLSSRADAYGNFYIIATVTPPADEVGNDLNMEPSPSEVADPVFDFYYPKGFAVLHNGELAFRTSARTTTFTNVPEGSHTYSVASLFKGENISKGVSCTVNVSAASIGAASASTASVEGAQGMVRISGFNGTATVCDPYGRTVAQTPCSGSVAVPAQPGIYVVTLADGNNRTSKKVVVY